MSDEITCSAGLAKVCGRCGITKSIDEFYKIVAKDEKSVRTDKVCKGCKGELKKARKSRNTLERSIIENPSGLDPKPIDSQAYAPENIQITGSASLSEESTEQLRKQKYAHPNYEDWEVQQAIEVFQILQKKRDEARRKGLINW
jgi:hypothetical protein